MTHILIFIHWFVLVFTFGNVELVTIDNSKSNDFPIEELNGYTLREVFEDGNLIDNFDFKTDNLSWWTSTLNVTVSDDKSIFFNASDSDSYLLKRGLLVNDNIYYIITNVNNISSTVRIDGLGFTNLQLQQGITKQIRTATANDFVITRTTANGVTNVELDYVYLYDLTLFGLSHLTVEEINDWFNVYQENAQREISETYDYIENELTTNDLIYIVLFALLWGLAIKIVKGVM